MLRKKRNSIGAVVAAIFDDENALVDTENMSPSKLDKSSGPLKSISVNKIHQREVGPRPKSSDQAKPAEVDITEIQEMHRSLSAKSPAAAIESAGTQIVQKALKLMALDEDGRPSPSNHNSPLFTFDSNSFLEKSMGAFNGVSRLIEGFAVTLDNVIVEAFEDWGTPKAGEGPRSASKRQSQFKTPKTASRPTGSQLTEWEDFDAPLDTENIMDGPSSYHGASRTKSKDVEQWRKRAQILHRELQKVRQQQAEFQRMREEYTKLKSDMAEKKNVSTTDPSEDASNAIEEMPTGLSPSIEDPAFADPLAAQQIMSQMQQLLEEKAKLAQENNRLIRENTGLQELLDFTMMHQATLIGDDELFADFGSEEEYAADEGCSDEDVQSDGGSQQEEHEDS